MKKTKMSLANIQGKLSRTEMKNIMAGSGPSGYYSGDCSLYDSSTGTTYYGTCGLFPNGDGTDNCECVTTYGPYVPSSGTSACQYQGA